MIMPVMISEYYAINCLWTNNILVIYPPVWYY